MIHHYGLLRTSFDPIFLSSVLELGAVLWETGTDCGHHSVTLMFSHPTDNELTIEYMFDHVLLHVLSFTLVPGWLVGGNGPSALLVSRIQGVHEHRDVARFAMKSLQGLAAPALLMAAAQGIADGWVWIRSSAFPQAVRFATRPAAGI